MKRLLLAVVVLGCLALQARADIVLNFASVNGATIAFNGSSQFSFPNTGTYDFTIGSEGTGGTGTALGLNGNISNVLFTIGAVTTNGSTETAPVTGSGTLSIFDGVNTFSSTVSWVNIQSFNAVGGLNYLASLNLSAMTYAGSNVDLLKLMLTPMDAADVTYQFTAPKDLVSLKVTPANTSYSGSIISTVPEPASVLGLGTVLLFLGARLRRKKA